MHDKTKEFLAQTKAACQGGALCCDAMDDALDALVKQLREAQASLREIQDGFRSKVMRGEPDTTIAGRLEPYDQQARSIDEQIQDLVKRSVRVVGNLKAFRAYDERARAEIEAGLGDGKMSLDLGSYFLDTKRLVDPKKRGKVVAEVVEEVRLRVETWAEKQSAP